MIRETLAQMGKPVWPLWGVILVVALDAFSSAALVDGAGVWGAAVIAAALNGVALILGTALSVLNARRAEQSTELRGDSPRLEH